jgi:hypothetical protein
MSGRWRFHIGHRQSLAPDGPQPVGRPWAVARAEREGKLFSKLRDLTALEGYSG